MSEYIKILERICSLEQVYSIRCYLVGGSVRDMLLSSHLFIPYDFDIAVEIHSSRYSDEDALDILKQLSRTLAQEYSGSYTLYEKYYTSSISCIVDTTSISIDFALVRKEKYLTPAGEAILRLGKGNTYYTIEQDLVRRDFTINAIALPLLSYIKLLRTQNREEEKDAYIYLEHGKKDIASRILRVIHEHSFLDDPIRMLRLITYIERCACTIEKKTRQAYEKALTAKVLDLVPVYAIHNHVLTSIQHAHSLLSLLRYYMQYGLFHRIFNSSYSLITMSKLLSQYQKYRSFIEDEGSQLFLLYSVVTYHRLASSKIHNASISIYMCYRKKKRFTPKTPLYSIGCMKEELYQHYMHTPYMAYITSLPLFQRYALQARKICIQYYTLCSNHTKENIQYHIACLCSSLATRYILYLLLQENIQYKIILEEYLVFKYTKKDKILFNADELPVHEHSVKKELYKHLIASIFVNNLYTKEEQLTCALEILQRINRGKNDTTMGSMAY